jgi:hypothetical protein
MMPNVIADHDWIKEQEKDGFLLGLDEDERKIWYNNLFDESVDAGFPTMKAYYIDKYPDRYHSRMNKSLETSNAEKKKKEARLAGVHSPGGGSGTPKVTMSDAQLTKAAGDFWVNLHREK